jgi:hypothetical protein
LQQVTSIQTKPQVNQEQYPIADVSRDGLMELRIGASKAGGVILTRHRNGESVELHGPWEESFEPTDACFAPDGKTFVVVAHGASRGDVQIFNTADGTPLMPPLYHAECNHALFVGDRRRLITLGNGEFRVWDLSTTPSQKVRTQPGVQWAATDQNAKILVTLSDNGSGIVWDTSNWQPVGHIDRGASWDSLRDERLVTPRPVLSKDGRRLAAAFGEHVMIWDVDSGKPLADPIDCVQQVDALTFPNPLSNELHVKLHDGAEVVWKSTDLPSPSALAQKDIEALTALVKYVGGSLSPGNTQWPDVRMDTNLGALVEHFRKLSEEQSLRGSSSENPENSSSEAIAAFWLEAGRKSCPPDPKSDLIQGLQQVASSSPEDKQSVDRLREAWKRRARREIELDLAGSTLRLPGKYEDLRLSVEDVGNYLKAALAFETENPVLRSGLAYFERQELKKISGDPQHPTEEIEEHKKEVDALDSEKTFPRASDDPEQAWNRAEVLAWIGKPERAAKFAQTACALDKGKGDYWVTQSVLFFALGDVEAGSHALDVAAGLPSSERDSAKLLKARFLIAQNRADEGAQLSLSVSDEQSDLPLAIWTCDWLASKGSFKEALDRLLKLDRLLTGSTANIELAKRAVDARIAACFWSLGQKVFATPYFQDLTGVDDLQALLDGLPQALFRAWRQVKMELEKQQNTTQDTSRSFSPPPNRDDATRLASAIADAERRLQVVYDALRAKLGRAEREALKRDENQWIRSKDLLPGNSQERLESIQKRLRVLEEQLNTFQS